MKLNKELMDKYNRLGLDMVLSENYFDIPLRNTLISLKCLPNILTVELGKLYETRLLLSDTEEETIECNTWIYIFNDVPHRKRIEKIKQIKDKINGTK